MGIREKRFYKAVNRIIQEEVQAGNLPSSKEFSWRLDNFLNEENLSRPKYRFRNTRDGQTATASDYNRTIDEIHEDLSTAYEGVIDIHNGLFKNFSKFEMDKGRLEYEIRLLESRLKDFILVYGDNGLLGTVHDVFDDMTHVDAEATTAEVDIKKNHVSIPAIKNTSRLVRPDASVVFSVLPELRGSTESIPLSGVPAFAMNENMNETWQHLVLSHSKSGIAGYYQVDFDEVTEINRISLELHGASPTGIQVDCSPDGINWFNLPYHEEMVQVKRSETFDFPTIAVRKIRILMRKDTPEEAGTSSAFLSNHDDGRNQFLFGMKALQFHRLSYPSEAVMITTPMKVQKADNENFTINKVSLSVEEEIPQATDIRYSIAVPRGNGAPEWRYISPVERENPRHDTIIDFRNITRSPAVEMGIDASKSTAEAELSNLYANGIRFYSIGEVSNKTLIHASERLYPGRNAWGMKRFTYRFDDHEDHVPSMADWESPRTITYGHVPIRDGQPGVLLSDTPSDAAEAYSYMFTAGVLSERAQTVTSNIPASTEPIAVYVNGREVYRGMPDERTRIPYEFNYGWNEIIVLTYVRNVGSANGVTVDMNIDLRRHGANIYAQASPMEKVSLHDLRFNTKASDHSKYATEEINGRTRVILNHALPGMVYDFLFHHIEGGISDEILFRAELTKQDGHSSITPKLRSYRLRFT